MKNFGHGHVRPRVDGVLARCGGPGLCSECALEMAQLKYFEELATCPESIDNLDMGDLADELEAPLEDKE